VGVDLLAWPQNVNDLSVPQVFRAIWHVLVTPVLVCRRCDSLDLFDTSYDSGGRIRVFEGELLHQTSCRGR
jgi:hypothetical protein